MGTGNYLWHFVLSALLCTIMALEGRDAMTAPAESHVDVSRGTNNSTNRTGPAAQSSDGSVAEPNTLTIHSPLSTTSLSPSTMMMVGGEGTMGTAPTAVMWERSSLRTFAKSPALPTRGAGTTTAPSTGTASGAASSLLLSSATTSYSSSSSSSSPVGSSAVAPSPQQSSTSSTPGTPLATTSQPRTALVFSSPSSTAGLTSAHLPAGTAETMTQGPASPSSVASTSGSSPASGTTEARLSPTLGSSAGTLTPEVSPTALTQGQPALEVMTASSPMGSPLPPVTTASVGSSATTPPGEGESSTMNQGIRTAEPSAETSHSLPSTSLVTPSMMSLSTSTSVNPSAGTCSPITLSIQLQNVTSTMIQFSWKPQGGRGDSPYTVRLLGKQGEMRETILNETSTAFENLLSGRQYQISVDISTCSKNVSTSLTVQTAAEVYSGTTRITNEDFKAEYQDKSSTEFKEFEKKFIVEITKHLPKKIQELKNRAKIRIEINSIENGSVVVHYDTVLDVGQNITKPEVSDAFIEALNRSTVFDIDLQNTFTEARNSCEPGFNDCDQNATCIPEEATYSCQCNKGFTDQSPQVPGRVCQQDLPSQHTTPVPPNNNTTSTTGTGSTAPVPPNTNITSTTGTGSTIPVPPNTNTTSTTETGSTTPVPPNNNTTSTTGTGSTTPVPPNTNITSTTGTGSTTPVPPNNNTTSTTGTGSTTPVPPNNNTTSTTGTGSTTPVPPNNNTTSTTGTGSTTPVPPNNNTTSTTGTGSTTPVPPNNNTTSTTGTGSTTPVPPNTNTTSTTGTGSTTPVPPNNNTTSTTGTGSTTPVPPNNNTTSTTGTGSTTPVPPNTNTTSTTGAGSTTPVPPNTNTTSTTGTGSTTPAPPNTNITAFARSTSNSVFTPTFSSAPCMTVSIKVQKVTIQEIQLSWTSSSKVSLYNISIMDGKEINTTTTNETKAVFKNLLPGHLYTISVAVSSCAENKNTSVTVRTDYDSCFKRTEFCSAQSTGCSDLKGTVCSNNQAFACRIRLENKTFNNALYNSHSEGYVEMSARIKRYVVEAMSAELGNDHSDIVMLGFRPGSVVAVFLFLLPKEDATDVDGIQAQLSKVLRSKFGNQTEVQSLSVQPSTDNSSSWRVAVIVLGVLLGVALVLILLAILFYIYVRRRSGMEFSTLYTW